MSNFDDDDKKTLYRIATIVERIDEKHGAQLQDHEKRLRKNEKFINRAIGWCVSAGILTASGAEIIKSKVGL